MDIEILKKAGLTDSQAAGYIALVEHGKLTANELADHTGESRTNCYAIIDRLTASGLAEKIDRTSLFRPTNPVNLRKMIYTKQKQLQQIDKEVLSILPNMQSMYRLANDLPGTNILEGVAGIQRLYSDILQTKDNISIITSKNDKLDAAVEKEINKQINKQKALGLAVRALYSTDDQLTRAEINELSGQGIEVKFANYKSHAQVIIYGNNVAISTFNEGMLTTLITHDQISDMFISLFDLVWSAASD